MAGIERKYNPETSAGKTVNNTQQRKSSTWPPPALPVCHCSIALMGFVQSVISPSGISSSVVFLPLTVFMFHAQCAGPPLEFTLLPAIALLSYAKIIHPPSSQSDSSSASPVSSALSPDSLLEPWCSSQTSCSLPHPIIRFCCRASWVVCCRLFPTFNRRVATLVVVG